MAPGAATKDENSAVWTSPLPLAADAAFPPPLSHGRGEGVGRGMALAYFRSS